MGNLQGVFSVPGDENYCVYFNPKTGKFSFLDSSDYAMPYGFFKPQGRMKLFLTAPMEYLT